jgi:hypothetical protein
LKLSVTDGFFWRSEIPMATLIDPYRTPDLCPLDLCPDRAKRDVSDTPTIAPDERVQKELHKDGWRGPLPLWQCEKLNSLRSIAQSLELRACNHWPRGESFIVKRIINVDLL